MRFHWKHYCNNDADLIHSWLDDDAMIQTGLEEGWEKFYHYWMTESRNGESKDRCFLISDDNIPFAVIYLAMADSEIVISELIVAPDLRGRGYGAAVINELLGNADQLLNAHATAAKAVTFPNNIASIKAFEKAGFVLMSKHQDEFGESLHYEYKFKPRT